MALSTPNGIGNWFHKTWVDAETGDNGFVPVKLPWTVHPERDQTWRDEQDRKLGARAAAQECDCLWGNTIITVMDTLSGEVFETTLEKLYEGLQECDYLL